MILRGAHVTSLRELTSWQSRMEVNDGDAGFIELIQKRSSHNQHPAGTYDDVGVILQDCCCDISEERFSRILNSFVGSRVLLLVLQKTVDIIINAKSLRPSSTNLMYAVGMLAFLARSRPNAFSRFEMTRTIFALGSSPLWHASIIA